MKKVLIGKLSDLDKNNQFSKWVEDHDVLVFRYNNKIKAYSNICPHFGGPIGHHKIKKNVDGNPVFTCLWHNLEFDIYKGKCIQSEKLKLREYDLSIEGDDIFVFLN